MPKSNKKVRYGIFGKLTSMKDRVEEYKKELEGFKKRRQQLLDSIKEVDKK